jgi:hypothetical protein
MKREENQISFVIMLMLQRRMVYGHRNTNKPYTQQLTSLQSNCIIVSFTATLAQVCSSTELEVERFAEFGSLTGC